MTATERKRRWRARNPERSQEYERHRAQARRDGYWDMQFYHQALQVWIDGKRIDATLIQPPPPRECGSHGSYRRYEFSFKRYQQRLLLRQLGPGASKWSKEDIKAAFAKKHDGWSIYQGPAAPRAGSAAPGTDEIGNSACLRVPS